MTICTSNFRKIRRTILFYLIATAIAFPSFINAHEDNPTYFLHTQHALVQLDYQTIPIPGYEPLGLSGLHYLHGINQWFYVGFGTDFAMLEGNYGGFFTLDVTTQIRHQIIGNLFGDAGFAFGGGAGGTSAANSLIIAGNGRYINTYAGMSYRLHNVFIGINYSYFHFSNSLINHAQVEFYIQKSISYGAGAYRYLDKTVHALSQLFYDKDCQNESKNVFGFELNNFFQYHPQGLSKKTINLVAVTFAHYLGANDFAFIEADAGYYGLPAYNQLVGGLGYHFLLFPKIGLITQLGVGSGGYDLAEMNTGSGLLIYPKFALEYSLTRHFALALTGGYLFAPQGTFQSFSAGAAINYYLMTGGKIQHDNIFDKPIFRGFRFHLFNQTEFDVKFQKPTPTNVNLISAEGDFFVREHWFIPAQASFAYTGYTGYGEALLGFGLQTKPAAAKHFQYFFQTMVGGNNASFIIKPELGVDYGLSDSIALYGMASQTIPINTQELNNFYSVGLGLTYRFSLLEN